MGEVDKTDNKDDTHNDDNERHTFDVEKEKLQIERDKLKLEGSWRKLWSAPILAAVVTVGVTVVTLLINKHQSDIANQQATAAGRSMGNQRS